LSLVALGRVQEAVTHFDEVAAQLGSTEAQLQAAQWRLLPGILRAPPISEAEVESARVTLRRLTEGSDVATRAAWTLALDANARDIPLAPQQWIQQVANDTSHASQLLAQHLDAATLAELEQYGRALDRSAELLPMSTGDSRPWVAGRSHEPFLRPILYLARAQWSTAMDAPDADAAWLWYENADVDGWPSGLPQSGEIDWALSTFARFHRGKAALLRGERDLGCPMLLRVLELWSNAEPAYDTLVGEARELIGERCTA
jgi:hypothetical protein